MKASLLLFASVSLAIFTMNAEANPDSGFPQSPEVHADGKVTFRLIAPGAEKVEIRSRLVDGKASLVKGEKDLWEFTTETVEPGIYGYRFLVDGMHTMDPHNRWVKGWRVSENLVEVPADPPAVWQQADVPHGVVHHHHFRSDVLKTDREVFVYTPPGYGAEPEREYPVLYLLHGSGDDASAWTAVGRAHFIADNLIAAGKIEPFVIVMPYGHGQRPGVDKEALQEKRAWYRENNAAVFADFFQSVIPLAEETYRLKTGPENTAIAGLSMGGGQALELGLNFPGRFGWVAGFSSGVPQNPEAASEQYGGLDPEASWKRIWIACGRDDFLLDRNEFFHSWLNEKGIDHDYELTEGGHQWFVWRDYLESWLSSGLFQ